MNALMLWSLKGARRFTFDLSRGVEPLTVRWRPELRGGLVLTGTALRMPMEVGLGIVPVTASPDLRGGVGARLRGPAAPRRVWGTLGFPTVNYCIGCQQPPSPIGWWTSLGVGMEFG